MDRIKTLLRGRAVLALIIALSIALGMSLAVNLSNRDTAYAADQKTTAQQHRAALHELQDAFTSVVDEVLPSVVSITSTRTVETNGTMPGFEDFFKDFPFPIPRPEMPEKRQDKSFGSGVIVRPNGYILTNDHVAGGADKVTVTLKDGRKFEGTVSRDPRSDLTVVKIDAKNLPAAKLGDSSKVKVGSWAIAIGNPFGLDQTVTLGVVSATGRQAVVAEGAGFYPNLIQTDASINLGNSGGPLVNTDGEIIGINTLIRSSFGGGSIGIGFAIPANTAKFVLEQLIATGKVTRGYLGIKPEDLTPDRATLYGVKEGAFVRTVEVGSPADKAGFQVEDVITEFDGKKVSNEIQFREMVAATPPGKQVSVFVVRDKAQKMLTVTLGEPPPLEAAEETPPESGAKLGFSVANITPELAKKYELEEGVKGAVVTKVSPGSSAAREGVRPGHVIIRANDRPINTVEDFNAATKGLKSGDTLRLRTRTKERVDLIIIEID